MYAENMDPAMQANPAVITQWISEAVIVPKEGPIRMTDSVCGGKRNDLAHRKANCGINPRKRISAV